MREAVIVSTARTPIGKAYRGAFNNTHGADMGAHAVRHAVERAGVAPDEVEDVLMGCAMPEGATGNNIARQIAIRAGLPVTTAGATVNRFCSSGMQTIAMAAQRVIVDGVPVMVAGGLESISLVQNENKNGFRAHNEWIDEHKPAIYDTMIQTAETVAKRYGITREVQDEYGLQSQLRIAAGQQAAKFDDEIVPMTTTKIVTDKETGETSEEEVTLEQDECNRPTTSLDGLAALQPVMGEDCFITAGNASQLSDGASACVVMDAKTAEKRGIEPLGYFRGLAVAGCEPDEMGIGLPRPRRRRLRAPSRSTRMVAGLRGAATTRAPRPEDGRHRPVGAQRGVRGASGLLPRQAQHSERDPERQRRRRRDRPSLWHERGTDGRPRADRRQTPGREERGLHHVHRRRHGGGWPVRSRVGD